jgi:uncharacterized protein YkwD
MLIEDARLEALGEPHYQRGKEGDVASAAVYCKISERGASMRGMNAPQGHLVQLMHAANMPEKQTTTQHLRTVLDTILHITPRERQLLDKRELEGDDSAEVLAEINQLRAERGKPPLDEQVTPGER